MLRAIIFDCDGVLVNSEPVHLKCFQKVLAEEGVTLSESEYLEKFLAMDDRGCFTAVLRANGRVVQSEELKRLTERKAKYFHEQMAENPPTFPGVAEFVKEAAKAFPLGIASGALRHEVNQAIRALGVADCFRVIVTAEDVVRGKPDPEAYLTAKERLNRLGLTPPLKPQECLVIEDSFHGVSAAKRAGMACLAVTNSYPAEKLQEADWVVSRLDEFELAKVISGPGEE